MTTTITRPPMPSSAREPNAGRCNAFIGDNLRITAENVAEGLNAMALVIGTSSEGIPQEAAPGLDLILDTMRKALQHGIEESSATIRPQRKIHIANDSLVAAALAIQGQIDAGNIVAANPATDEAFDALREFGVAVGSLRQ